MIPSKPVSPLTQSASPQTPVPIHLFSGRKARKRLLIGLVVGLSYWVIESIVMSFFYQEQTIIQQMLVPSAHEIGQRVSILGFVFVFVLSLHVVITKREQAEEQLAQSEIKYRTLVEGVDHAIFIINRAGTIDFANNGAARYLKTKPNAIIGQTIWDILPESLAQSLMADIETVLSQDKSLIVERCWQLEKRQIWIEFNIQPLKNGSVSADTIIGTARDITDRKKTEEDYQQRNQELAILNTIAATVNQSLDLNQILHNALNEVLTLEMFDNDAKGMILLLNEQSHSLSLAAHQGSMDDHPCLHHSVRVGECLCGLAILQQQIVISKNSSGDPRHMRRWPGMPQHQDICLPIKARGKVLGTLNVRVPLHRQMEKRELDLLNAVTDQMGVAIENAQLFEAVNRQREQVRVLAARVSNAEEGERRRLAIELHDRVGQNLTAMGINLHLIRSEVPETSQIMARIEESFVLLDLTTDSIREVMAELRPPMFDDYGLVATLNWYSEQLSMRSGLAISIRSRDVTRHVASPSIEIALFRIAQEALTNVAKHAEAAHVAITLEKEGNLVRMSIADDGKGFNPYLLGEPEEDHGWGHLIMAERAEAVGGSCRFESRPFFNGTRVIVEVPQ